MNFSLLPLWTLSARQGPVLCHAQSIQTKPNHSKILLLCKVMFPGSFHPLNTVHKTVQFLQLLMLRPVVTPPACWRYLHKSTVFLGLWNSWDFFDLWYFTILPVHYEKTYGGLFGHRSLQLWEGGYVQHLGLTWRNKVRNDTNDSLFKKFNVFQEICKPSRQTHTDVRKLWTSCEKVVKKLWESCEKFVRKLWESCEKVVRKFWERYKEVVRNNFYLM